MTIEQEVIEKKLNIRRKGTILYNLGQVRGITTVDPCGMARTDLKSTRVRYISADEIPPIGEPANSFFFYSSRDFLPLIIEGWQFEFGEVYSGEKREGIPIKQVLVAYLDSNGVREREKRFEFSRNE